MNQKKILRWLLLSTALTANITVFAFSNARDSLLFRIVKVSSDTNKIDNKAINVNRLYDFKAQYPFYTLNKNDWKDGDIIQLKFTTLPKIGYLYAFSIDTKGIVKTCGHYDLSKYAGNAIGSGLIIPGKDSVLSIDQPEKGEQYLCIFYCINKPLDDFEKVAGGLEMTMGTMVQRIVNQIPKRIFLPYSGWELNAPVAGVLLNYEYNYIDPNDRIIPIIMKFSNTTDMVASGKKIKKRMRKK